MPKWVSFVILFLAVVVTPITILFFDYFVTPASSWYDNAWEYRKPIEITNGGGNKTDYDVLVQVDTEALISEGKIQNDCDDIRFVDSDDTTVLNYWIETGCNTSSTEVWVRVPSITGSGKTIYMYYGNGSAVSGGQTYSGNRLFLYEGGACPAGSSIVSGASNRFLYGNASYGTTGSGGSHSHSTISCTSSSINTASISGPNGGGSDSASSTTHTHMHTASMNSASNVLPPYRNFLLCLSSSAILPAGSISLFDQSTPDGWTRVSSFDGSFARSASTSGSTGGSLTHTHAIASGTLSGTSSDSINMSAGQASGGNLTVVSSTNQYHTFTSSGTFTLYGNLSAQVLVVGGGGGGAGGNSSAGGRGGGGGGGVVYNSSMPLTAGSYSVTVGAGGTAGTGGHPSPLNGGNGGNSIFSSITAIGGGGGGAPFLNPGLSGGSAGGSAGTETPVYGTAGTAGQGNAGGMGGGGSNSNNWRGGGGGGASAAGQDGYLGGNGGAGLSNSITNSAVVYGSGGGGGIINATAGTGGSGAGRGGNSSQTATAGTANRGGGGGGGGNHQFGTTYSNGGAGGSGVVIVRYNLDSLKHIANGGHRHSSATGVTDTGSNIPPYKDMIFASKNEQGSPVVGSIVMFDSLPVYGWTRYTELDDKYARSSSNPGGTGGSSTHSHSATINSAAPNTSGTYRTVGTASFADGVHTHSCTTTTNEVSHLPARYSVIYGQKIDNSADLVSIEFQSEESNVPTSPTSLASQALSTTSIRWNFIDNSDDEVGFRVLDSLGEVKATCEGEDLEYCDETGLSPNTQYTRYIVAYNANGNSDNSDAVSRFTLIGNPILTIPTTTTNSMELSVSGVNNLSSGDSGLFYDCVGGECPEEEGEETVWYDEAWPYRVKLTIDNSSLEENLEDFIVYVDLSTLPIQFHNNVNQTDARDIRVAGHGGDFEFSRDVVFYDSDNNTGELHFLYSGFINQSGDNEVYIYFGNPAAEDYSYDHYYGRNRVWYDNFSPEMAAIYHLGEDGPTGSNGYKDSRGVSDGTGGNGNGSAVPVREVAGKIGYGQRFDGTNDYIEVPHNSNLVPSGYVSASAWFKLDQLSSTKGSGQFVLRKYCTTCDGDHSYGILADGNDAIRFYVTTLDTGETSYVRTSNSFVSADTWYHVTGVWGSSGLKIYVNGNDQSNYVSEEPLDTSIVTTSNPMRIGALNSGADFFDGVIDELRIVNGERTEAWIELEYENQSNPVEFFTVGSVESLESDDEGWSQNTSRTIGGLDSNTQYSYRVKARNGDGVETSYSSILPVYTHAFVPEIETVSVTQTTITVRVDNILNLTSGQSGIYFQCNDFICPEGDPGWRTGTEFVFDIDSPGAEYQFIAKARNGDGVETSFSTPAHSIHSLANVPLAPVASDIGSDSFRVKLNDDQNSNPSTVEYSVLYGVNQYVDPSTGDLSETPLWEDHATWNAGEGVLVDGVTEASNHTLKAKARNSQNAETEYSEETEFYTLLSAPTMSEPDVLSSNSVRWGFTDNSDFEEGFKLYNEENDLILTCEGENLTFCDEVDLDPNNTYTRKVVAYSDIIDGDVSLASPYSESQEAVTFANSPTISELSATEDTVTVILNVSNPEGTEIALYEEESDKYFNPDLGTLVDGIVWFTDTGGVEGLEVTGLISNSEYTFRVKARNSDDVETSYSSPSNIHTLSSVPSIDSVTSTSSSSITVVIDSEDNPGSTEYALRESSGNKYVDPSNGELVDNPVWATFATYGGSEGVIVIGLSSNTQYTFDVKSRNSDQIESAYSSQSSTYTRANVPSIVSLEAQGSSTLLVVLNNSSNPAGTEVVLFEENSELYYNPSTDELSESISWFSDIGGEEGVVVGGLERNTEYTFSVRARNSSSVETSQSDSLSTYTLVDQASISFVNANSSSSLAVAIFTSGNPVSTEYLLREVNSDKYVDPSSGELVDSPAWGVYSSFGGGSGEIVSGLSVNTQYAFEVKARNSNEVETNYSPPVYQFTNSLVPSIDEVSAVSSSEVLVVIDNSANPALTQIALQEVGSGMFINASGELVESISWFAETGGEDGITISDLIPNTEYEFRVRSRNGDNIETSWSDTGSVYTLAASPTVSSLEGTSSSIVNVVIDPMGNPVGTEFVLRESSSNKFVDPSDGELVDSEVWGEFSSYGGVDGIDVINLTPNTEYTFEVKARNTSEVETGYSDSSSVYTLANVPSVVSLEASSSSSLLVVLDNSSNPEGTEIVLRENSLSLYVNIETGVLQESPSWGTVAQWGGEEGMTITGLYPNNSYTLSTSARNGDEIQTSFSQSEATYTLAIVPGSLDLQLVDTTTVKATLDVNGNTSNTQFAIFNDTDSKYISYVDGSQSDTAVWGTYAQWGGEDGVNTAVTGSGIDYEFFAKARNFNNIETDFSIGSNISTTLSTPEIGTPERLTSTSMRWTFTSSENNADGFRVYDQEGVQVAQCVGSDITFCDETGLTPNTSYTRKVAAYNENGRSEYSQNVTRSTKSAVPSFDIAQATSSTQIQLAIDINNNSAPTQYQITETVSGLNVGNISGGQATLLESDSWYTYEQLGSLEGVTISDLFANAEYVFEVTSRDSENEVSEASDPVTVYTLAVRAGAPVLNAVSNSELNLVINTGGNSSVTTFSLMDSSTGDYLNYINGLWEDDPVWGTYVQWGGNTGVQVTGLSTNSRYDYVAVSRNGQNIESEISDVGSRYTLALVPSISSVSSNTVSSASVEISNSVNPSGTEVSLFEESTNKFVNPSNGALVDSPVWFNSTGGALDVVGLNANSEYRFKVRGRNNDSIETNYSAVSSIVTLANAPSVESVVGLSTSSVNVKFTNTSSTYSIRDSNSGKFVNPSNGVLVDSEVWSTYGQLGGTNGINVTGLLPNTQYTFEVRGRNSSNVNTAFSQGSSGYTHANTPGVSTVSQITNSSARITLNSNQNPINTEYLVLDVNSNRYVDSRNGSLTNTPRWSRLSDLGGSTGITINGLNAGARFEFIVRARNGSLVETQASPSVAGFAHANIPSVSDANIITLRSVRLRINRNQNDPSVVYSIQEETQGRYIDFRNGSFVDQPVWGTYTEFGGDSGVSVPGLSPVSDYLFRVNARNSDGVVTGFGPRRLYGTNAIIENVPPGVALRLKANTSVDPTRDVGGQRGLHDIRVRKDNSVIADVPVEFARNLDWSGTTIVSEGGKVVVKFSDTSGFKGTYTMYVPKGDTNRFKLCTKAESLEEVNSECAGSVVFAGPYPQTIAVDERTITVSVSVIDGVSYWAVAGLTGTGGFGEKVDTEGEVVPSPSVNEPDEEEDNEGSGGGSNNPPITVNPVVNTPNQTFNDVANTIIATVTQTTPAQAIDGVRIAIDSSPVGSLPQPQLTAVTTTATAATVTVGIAAVGGGFSSVPYILTQFFFGVLSFLGFRKKGKPYGYVYDSVTKEPISRAIVRIYDGNDKLVWTDVTDVYGSFNVELPKGRYKIFVKKAGFSYPTMIIKGVVDYPIEPIYKGELIKFTKKEDLRVHIPMDPNKVKGVKKLFISAKSSVNFIFKILHIIVFIGGIILGAYTMYKYPSVLNAAVLAFYIPAFVMLFKSLFGAEVQYGVVKDDKGKVVTDVEIALRELKFDRFVTKRITDAQGRYRFVIYPGDYELVIIGNNYKAMRFEGGSNVVNVTAKGSKIVAKDIVVKRKKSS